MVVYGIDGCKGGWFHTRLDEGVLAFGTVKRVSDLLDTVANDSRIFIDIPIGLRDAAPEGRHCDVEARQLLKPWRQSSVFTAPIRAILKQSSHGAASALSRRLIGKGISQQTFNIMGKIQEIDALMTSSGKARSTIREVHPELCFFGLAGGSPMRHNKKKPAGFEERLVALEKYLPTVRQSVDAALQCYPRSLVARDDILDSIVCALTAWKSELWRTVPLDPQLDSQGIPMEMVYCQG